MNIARIFAVAITLGVLSTASSQEAQKQDAPQAAKPAADAPSNAPQAPATPSSVPQPATGAQAPASTASPPPPPSAAVGKTGVINKDNEFIPTEEIQPDEAVTFPIDI